ncbi:hypothetical protein MB901379_02190 [Mycobacterium basiliense]|uniref:Fatty acyl-AMP ligase FadD28 and polyketide synthase n=1 Tax=Mycobacterium basiliense TaxID=2094119 RepID=A0A3S4CBE4_9MYCO|nr:hypothetical protein [Mycobacterium basiliense]VDM88627.1 hypothetical protein MB901379_02190 [Mycobacterium basiliense]
MTDDRVAYLDHASFLRLRATDLETVGQTLWIYDRKVDMDALQRFNENLGYGLLGRRIERSPLPFGRPRWVVCHDAPDIDVAVMPRPRSEITAWLNERGRILVDPEYGPGWHLGVLPLEDGGTAVSLLISHTLVDGLGGSLAIYEAMNDITRDFGYPPSRSRSRMRRLFIDLWDALRELPEVFRALFACIMILLRRDTGAAGRPATTPPAGDGDEPITIPSITLFCDLSAWDARALDLGGSSNALLVAIATRLAQLMGRVRAADGAVSIVMPVSERTADDTRANALTAITFDLDPDRARTDLQIIRNEIKQGLAALGDTPNELLKPLPLVPYTPKWLARKIEGLALGNSDLPVGCSNLRDLSQGLTRVDGTEADWSSARLFTRGATKGRYERDSGELFLGSGRLHGKIFISICGYQPGAENSNQYLRALAEQALADYSLTAEIIQ